MNKLKCYCKLVSLADRGNANFSIFLYQHDGIPNAKLWHWGCKPTRGPNTNGFALQWNIGFTVHVVQTGMSIPGMCIAPIPYPPWSTMLITDRPV